jgi:DUF4097 and DUF4098 domain-containing protein YvlB
LANEGIPGMKIFSIIGAAILLLGATQNGKALTEEKIHKQFQAAHGGNLVVEVGFGAIQVKTNQGQQVVVDVVRKVTRAKKAQEEAFLKENPVLFSASEGIIRIESKGAGETRQSFFSWNRNSRNEALYVISVPEQFNIELKTAGGGIEVKGTQGKLNARTAGGRLEFEAVQGPVDGRTAGGGVYAKGCEGDLKLRTSGGRIEVSGGSGSLEAVTSGGGIALHTFRGPAKVTTSGGAIRIHHVTGALEASTSGGSIEATLSNLDAPVKLATSGGHVTVHVPENAAFDLDAQTSAGRVNSDLALSAEGKPERNRIAGKVNGGGKQVHLRTSGGGINVRKS